MSRPLACSDRVDCPSTSLEEAIAVPNQNSSLWHTQLVKLSIVCVILAAVVAGGCGTTSSTSTATQTSSPTQVTAAASLSSPTAASPPKLSRSPRSERKTTRTRAPTTTAATPSSTVLSPNQILAAGEQAVKAKTVSAPIFTAAVKLGTAQSQQLGQPSTQYVATAAYIGYLEQLQGLCTDPPSQLANVVINAGDALRKTDQSVTYGHVMRVLYQSAVGRPKHACAAQLAAATAAIAAP